MNVEHGKFQKFILFRPKGYQKTHNFTLIPILMVPRLQDFKKYEFLNFKVVNMNFQKFVIFTPKGYQKTQNFTLIPIMMVPRLQDRKKY